MGYEFLLDSVLSLGVVFYLLVLTLVLGWLRLHSWLPALVSQVVGYRCESPRQISGTLVPGFLPHLLVFSSWS